MELPKWMHTKLTAEWSEYNHDYEKNMQDIKCKDGAMHFECWPNAGMWHTSDGLLIYDEEVTHTRLSESNFNH